MAARLGVQIEFVTNMLPNVRPSRASRSMLRRLVHPRPVGADGLRRVVVRHDEDDVGPIGGDRGRGERGQHGEDGERAERANESHGAITSWHGGAPAACATGYRRRRAAVRHSALGVRHGSPGTRALPGPRAPSEAVPIADSQ